MDISCHSHSKRLCKMKRRTDDVVTLLGVGREAIVNTFADLTTPSIQEETWRRTQ